MNKMRAVIEENNIYRWAGKIVQTMSGMDVAEMPEPESEQALAGAGVNA